MERLPEGLLARALARPDVYQRFSVTASGDSAKFQLIDGDEPRGFFQLRLGGDGTVGTRLEALTQSSSRLVSLELSQDERALIVGLLRSFVTRWGTLDPVSQFRGHKTAGLGVASFPVVQQIDLLRVAARMLPAMAGEYAFVRPELLAFSEALHAARDEAPTELPMKELLRRLDGVVRGELDAMAAARARNSDGLVPLPRSTRR